MPLHHHTTDNGGRGVSRIGRRTFLARSTLAGLFLLSPTVARAATKTTKATRATRTTKKATATTAARAAAGSTFDPTKELAVAFTYAPSDGGFRVHNPYVAVYIEDANGALVRTIDLSIEASGRGLRYVNELRRWYRAANGGDDAIQTVSSPTRMPGTYKVSWDGRDDQKALVPLGTYYVCIEAAREHGPYELIREPITIGTAELTKELPDNGELQGASVALRSRS